MTHNIERNKVIYTEGERPIIYDLYYKKDHQSKPVVIFCHGYKGFKDWGAWDLVAKTFAEQGFFFLKFNFSHNGGTVDQPIDFPDLEAFSENTYSIEQRDISNILKELEAFADEADNKQVYIIGHSRGAGSALIAAELHDNILATATWAGVSDFAARFYEGSEQFEEWKKTGITYVENARTKQLLPHKFSFYEDFDENREAFNIQRAISNTKKPVLVLHGDKDTTVSLAEAERLKKWGNQTKLHIVADADHVFESKHPWEEKNLPKQLKEVVNETIEFFKNIQNNK